MQVGLGLSHCRDPCPFHKKEKLLCKEKQRLKEGDGTALRWKTNQLKEGNLSSESPVCSLKGMYVPVSIRDGEGWKGCSCISLIQELKV